MGRKHSFPRRHWIVIGIGFLLFYFFNTCTSDGMNVILPRLASERGWDYAQVLSLVTLAGCVSVVGQLLFSLLCRKVGPKITIVSALFGAACFMVLYAAAPSIPVYVVALSGVTICSSAHSYVGGSTLLANWFPTKKGIALGYASVGAPVATATVAAALTMFFTAVGFLPTMVGVACLLAALGVACIFLLHDTPEECGEYPDGLAPEERGGEAPPESSQEGQMSLKQMLRCREMWLSGLIFGIFSLVSTGVMGQFVLRHRETGMGEPMVLLLLTVCALVGIAGSPILGRLEHRLGTRPAFRICCGLYAAALLLNFTNVLPLVYLSVVMLGLVITGVPIFFPSFLVSIFDRTNFKTAYAIAFPLSSVIGQTAYLLVALTLRLTGESRYVYPVFAVLMLVCILLTGLLRMDRWKKA